MIRGVLKGKQHRWSLSARVGDVGRPKSRAVGGWIHDLMVLGKAVMLCMGCSGRMAKSDLLKYGYQRVKNVVGFDYVTADCDACRAKLQKCWFFQKRAR